MSSLIQCVTVDVNVTLKIDMSYLNLASSVLLFSCFVCYVSEIVSFSLFLAPLGLLSFHGNISATLRGAGG